MAGQVLATRDARPVYVDDFLRNSNNSNLLARQTQKTLSQLGKTTAEIARSQRAIEQHTARIAAATERQNDISLRQLAEAERQTAISEQQLEMAKVADLERRFQIELKQAAYALNEALSTPHTDSPIQRLYNLHVSKGVLSEIGVSPDAAHEIADKEYVRDALRKLDDEYNAIVLSLGDNVQNALENYVNAKNSLSAIDRQLASLNFGDGNASDPGTFSFKNVLLKSFYPIPLRHSVQDSNEKYVRLQKKAEKMNYNFDMDAAIEKDRAKEGKFRVATNIILGPLWIAFVVASTGALIPIAFVLQSLNHAGKRDKYNKSVKSSALAHSNSERLVQEKAKYERITAEFEANYGVLATG